MGFYAQYDNSTGAIGQAEMAEQRRVDELVKRIEAQQAVVMGSLRLWLRNQQWAAKNDRPLPASANVAMERLIEARREENRLFKVLFGIDAELRAIEDKSRG
jgi:hypothetical protein